MQTQEIIWRNDDIAFEHIAHNGEKAMDEDFLFNKFVEVDKLFIKYGVKHTIAIICHDFFKAERMIAYIKAHPHIDVQLHCYRHEDYTLLNPIVIESELMKSKVVFLNTFVKLPKVFYPPFNKVNDELIKTVNKFKLEVSFEKMSIQGYLKGQQQKVINFHSWADECVDLEEALIKYITR